MSARAPKPLFLTTKGDRNDQPELLDPMIVQHYREVASGLYRWEGLPEDVPEGWIEDTALYYAPAVGMKRVKGYGLVVLACEPSTLDIYGRPYDWLPAALNGWRPMPSADLTSASREPCLWMGRSTYALIEPYVEIMSNAVRTLNTNIDALNQPVILSGIPAAELGTMVIRDALLSKDRTIPTTGVGFSAEVLDMKAQDHTQNLISTIDWCDARILEAIASSNGIEKSSGINTLETVSGVQSVMQQMYSGLSKRRAWADAVNDRFGLSVTVELGQGAEALTGRPQDASRPNGGKEVSDDGAGE